MTITVRQMLRIPELRRMKIVAGESGLDTNLVSTVTVLDAPDIERWVHGGEFVITSGYIFKDDPTALVQVIENLSKGGMAAIGIKLERFLKTLPTEVIEAANKLRFPIINVPIDFAFSDIINPVLSNVVNAQAQELRFSEKVSQSFYELIMNGESIDEILDNLQYFIHVDLAFVDTVFGQNYYCAQSEDFVDRIRRTSLPQLVREIPNRQAVIGDKTYGYLFFDVEDLGTLPKSWDISISHAITAILICTQKRIAKSEAEKRYRDEFVQDILLKNVRFEKEVWNRAQLFDWDLRGPQAVMVVDIDNYKHQFETARQIDEAVATLDEVKQRIYNISTSITKKDFPNVPYAEMSDSIAYIIPSSLRDYDEFKKKLLRTLTSIQEEVSKKTHFTVTIGVGNTKDSIFACHQSYEEAQKALEMIRTTCGGGHAIFWRDLGVYKLLGNLYNTKEAVAFYYDYIGKLIEHDKKKKNQLVETLETIVRCNWQLKAAAQDLSLHYNTLKYRYRKICELIDLNTNDSEDRLNVALSLKLYLMDKYLDK
ncbi:MULTISPECIES: PucR family transcriptional regulator [Aminobacterium]|jgi:purine catabolism regulator|uniref:PucR family transcriptional regulator n=1 Tax=Aminobacterium TaxID=81466 RepID=UPI000464D3D9|nr:MULTISPECIES: PucR family transcriptional regulator [Aminobacterium]